MKCLATFAFMLLIVGRTYAAGNVIDGPDADLVYDYRTGLAVLDGADLESERFFGFAIQSHSIRPIPSDRLPIFPGGQELCDCGHFLGFQDWSGVGAEFVDLGEILPPCMRSVADLEASLSLAHIYSQLLQTGMFPLCGVLWIWWWFPSPQERCCFGRSYCFIDTGEMDGGDWAVCDDPLRKIIRGIYDGRMVPVRAVLPLPSAHR
jgi:hypothetical protein